jgi:predicted nucleic acid-binding protein
VNLFLDSSVLLAACGSATGASRALFQLALQNGWMLLASGYVLSEVERNLRLLSPAAIEDWQRLRPQLRVVDDVLSLDRPAIFPASKDRPVLFTALAWADVLLTLDRGDFDAVIGRQFYGLPVLVPADFLIRERSAGRLIDKR